MSEVLWPGDVEYQRDVISHQLASEWDAEEVSCFIATIEHLAHALFEHHTGDISNVPDPVIKAWLEWASKHKGELK